MQLLLILIMGTFGVMGGSLLAPGLPTFAAAFNVERGTVGLVLSVYTMAAAFSLPFLGYLIDSWGRRKVGLICLFFDGFFGLLSIFAPSFIYLLIFRFFQGIGVAGLIPVAMTIIGDWYDGAKRLKIIGYFISILSLGSVVIPLLGGFLVSIDWRLPFIVYGFSIVLMILFYFLISETSTKIIDKNNSNKKESSDFKEYLSQLFKVLKIKSIIEVLIHAFFSYFLLYTIVTYIPIYLNDFHGFGETISGFALSLQGLFSAIAASQIKYLSRFRWQSRITAGFILTGFSLIILPFWEAGNIIVMISIIIFGSGMGILNPVIYDRVTDLPPDELSGSVIALFNTMKYIGMTAAPIIVGIMINYVSLKSAFIMVGIIIILWAGNFIIKSEIKI